LQANIYSLTLNHKVLLMKPEQTPSDSLQDLQAIRSIMENSARFLSLSGLSGVWAGITALAGAGVAHVCIRSYYQDYNARGHFSGEAFDALQVKLLVLAIVVLGVALAGGYLFTHLKVKKQGGRLLNMASRKMLLNLAIPLLTGAVFILGMLYHHTWLLAAPACLVFYGLALLNGSKYTLHDIRYLGVLEISLGLVALFFPAWSLYFWALGFGVLHIVYGLIMWLKYDRK
jgi:hypothetical protein